MLGNYLNMTAVQEKFIKISDRGEPEYGSKIEISCRRYGMQRIIKRKDGEEVMSKYVYYINERVNINDLIDGMVVLEAGGWQGLNGKTLGYKAVV